MISVIPDTNVIISGMMGYKSPSRQILNLSMARKIKLIGCSQTLSEFSTRVRLPRMQRYWQKKYFSPEKLVRDYQTMMLMHEPLPEFEAMKIEIQDKDDAIFFKLALSCNARIIISQDKHALALHGFRGLKVVTPEKFVEVYTKLKQS